MPNNLFKRNAWRQARPLFGDLGRLVRMSNKDSDVAILIRGWQLGHRDWSLRGTDSVDRTTVYEVRCRCGWQSGWLPQKQAYNDGWEHLYEAVFAVDGYLITKVSDWPRGVRPSQTLGQVRAALEALDEQGD